jgi:site-specific DNA-methyltransferase (cytosine-N4-specific)
VTARFLVGDVYDGLATLPDDSVDLVFSSPPFLALRSYLPADHPDKSKEIGSEPTPADFLDTLLDVVEACDRVLAPHGTLCFELGDTYAGSGGAGGDYNAEGLRDGAPKFDGAARRMRQADGDAGKPQVKGTGGPLNRGGGLVPLNAGRGWPQDKSLCFIPELFGASLAYGRNLLRPERETPPWRIRNFTVWHRPNPPVGALGDKWRPSCSFVTVACKSRTRWFDLDAVRLGLSEHSQRYYLDGSDYRDRMLERRDDRKLNPDRADVGFMESRGVHPAGAPPLDCLILPTEPYPGAHYATFPRRLVEPFVLSMCPVKVCRECGEPSRRIVEPTQEYASRPNAGRDFLGTGHDRGKGLSAEAPYRPGSDPSRKGASFNTLGFTDCGHDNYRQGVTLDPFAGSGTTLEVAHGNGRHAIGVDLDQRNAELARDRLGMFLDVEVLAFDLETSA